ncbi:MAG: hypothetical protein B7Z09_10385 [Brevundimonas diminuta]|nr:MAG: hypothetical protein B7Z09_10385 [Brevundimonas diminuta]
MPVSPAYRPEPRFFDLGADYGDAVKAADFPQTILRLRNDRAAAASWRRRCGKSLKAIRTSASLKQPPSAREAALKQRATASRAIALLQVAFSTWEPKARARRRGRVMRTDG